MNILLNALGAQMGGAKRHLESFLIELDQRSSSYQYTALIREGVFDFNKLESVKIVEIPQSSLNNWRKRLSFDLFHLPTILRRDEYDACVSLLNFGPLACCCPHIVFQRNALYFDRSQLKKMQWKNRIGLLLRRYQALVVMRGADLIVTPSDSMRNLVQTTSRGLEHKAMVVLKHGFSSSDYLNPLSLELADKLDQAHGMKIVYPTHLAVHKGFDFLVETLALLKKMEVDFTLVLTIESADWPEGYQRFISEIDRRGINEMVINLGTVPHNQMAAVYEACDVMFYPSRCESFGFSLVEAMAFGLPVIAGELSIFKEICGNAGMYYQDDHAKQAAMLIKSLVNTGEFNSRKALIEQQFASHDWSWGRYVQEFEQLLKNLPHVHEDLSGV